MRARFLLLTFLAACGSTDEATLGGESGGITWGACEGTADGKDRDSVWEDDGDIFVYADQNDGQILFHILNLPANCCPDPEATAALDAGTLRLDFTDVKADGVPCRCSCVIDFLVTVDGFDPPTEGYAYEVWYAGGLIGEGTTIEVF